MLRLRRFAPAIAILVAAGLCPARPAGAAVTTAMDNPSLETDADGNRVPDCWQQGGFGTNAYRWVRATSARTGTYAQTVELTSWTSGDRKLVTRQDAGSCSPAVVPGVSYRIGAWYHGTVKTTLAVYYRNAGGAWVFWFKSAEQPPAATWSQIGVTTPPVPAGATAVSFGLAIGSVGSLTMDDFSFAPATLFADGFSGADRLVTNEFAYWNPTDSRAVVSPDWEMDSGSLFVSGGTGWTGVPDDRAPDPTSSTGTNSAIFRLTTKRADFGNVAVGFRLRTDRMVSTPSTPAVAWDGVHVFLRYQSEEHLYYASVNRRDGTVAVKKKVPGGPSNGGTYYTLATGTHVVPYGAWQTVDAKVANQADGSVRIVVTVNGRVVATAVDSGVGGAPITAPGKVGVRGDNTEFRFDDFTVS